MNRRVTSREHILEHAMELSVKDGIASLSIRKLSGDCNIAVGSIYNYFPSKKALVAAVAEQFWSATLADQKKVYRNGMKFTDFLGQYYDYIYGKMTSYDRSWMAEIGGKSSAKEAVELFLMVLRADKSVDNSIWNMELTEESFCEYVFTNLMALLQAGESNCRFFIFLIENLLKKGTK